jgi:hypothetical protein
MDVRVRWLLLERPMPWFMLEFLVCSLVIGAMTLAAARTIPRIMQHVRVLETVALVSAAITSTMEYRAVTGAWPDGSARASMSSALSPASGLVSSARRAQSTTPCPRGRGVPPEILSPFEPGRIPAAPICRWHGTAATPARHP